MTPIRPLSSWYRNSRSLSGTPAATARPPGGAAWRGEHVARSIVIPRRGPAGKVTAPVQSVGWESDRSYPRSDKPCDRAVVHRTSTRWGWRCSNGSLRPHRGPRTNHATVLYPRIVYGSICLVADVLGKRVE